MKKLIAILLATTTLFAMMAITASAKTYYVSDWAEEANDALELTWSEDPTKNVSKGEFMFSFLRMIQASLARNDDDILESDTDLDFEDADDLNENEQDEARILVDLGVLNGYNGYMNMDNDVTRAEAAKILYYFDDEVLNLDVVRKNPNFGDIGNHWAEDKINYAYKIGMINGCGLDTDGTMVYNPEGNLTVQEMVQIMYNISLVNSNYIEEDIAYALVETFNVETDLDIEDYDDYYSDDDESILYLNVDDIVTFTSEDSNYWSSSKPSVASVSSKGKITAKSEGTAIISNSDDIVIKVIVGDSVHYVTVGDELSLSKYTSSAWKTSNKKVATVENGTVTGIKEGTVTISRGTYESYTVKVVEETVIEMELDDTIKLGNSSANWKSSNEDVVEVSSKGTVTAVGSGTATVSSKYADYLIFVSPSSALTMNIGDTIKFEDNAKWTSSKPTVISVNSNGTIKALRNGTATLTDNKNNTIIITVGNYSSDYTRCYTLYVGETKTLGDGDYDKNWESDDTKIATVTKYGKVTAKKVGETTVYNDDDEYLITVINDYEEEDFEYTIVVGEKTLIGDGSYDSSWESENTKIATVDNYGFVNAKKVGETVVYNDDYEYYITVVEDDDEEYEYTIIVGETARIGDGSYDSSWKSENTKIATVNKYGTVTAKKAGETIVYNDDNEYIITVIEEDDDDNNNSDNNSDDNENDYGKTIIYVEGYEPSSYYNAWVNDTIKIVVESENGDLEDVTISNSKCKLTKDINSLGNNKYTFTVNSVSAGACILTLEFEDSTDIEFTINSYKE